MNTMVAKRGTAVRVRDVVDLTSDDSFPASDPPSWTPVVGTGSPCRVGRRSRVTAPAVRDEDSARGFAVLHPTDYSAAARCAFEVACRAAGARGRVTALHVPEPPHVPFGMATSPPLPPGYRGAWLSQLELMRPPDPSVPVEHRLEEGDPAAGILRGASESACDLIVMGAGQRGGLWRTLAGSVSRAVARRARCPVLRVTVPDERSHPVTPRRVILATDREEPDAYAFEFARSLARNSGEELFALFVRPAGGSDGGKAVDSRLTARGSGVEPLVRVGSLVEEVLRAAHDLRPALVVMGSPARTGVGELFDPARAFRRRAACPVLSVHLPAGRRSRVAGMAAAPRAFSQEGRA